MSVISQRHLALMAALGLGACATSAAATRQQELDAVAADEQAQAGLHEYHRHQHRGGVMQFVAMALDTVEPGDASRPKVEALQADLYACMAPAAAVQLRLRLTVADGVAAGAVDLAALDVIIGQLDVAAAGVRDCGVAALNGLHAALSPLERAELIEKVQAHWEVWRQVNSEEEPAARGTGGRLGALARELSLTPDQVERASAALHTALSGQPARFDRPGADADVQAFATAFEGPTFDARTTPMQAGHRMATFGATRMAIFYETVTPLLTPPQRAALAGHLRERAGQSPAVSAN